MYNEERKLAFFNRKRRVASRDTHGKERNERINKMILALFNASEKYEMQHNKDLCEFSESELKDIFENALGKSYSATKNYLLLINKYVKWCRERGYKCYKHSKDKAELKIEYTQKYKEQMISSPLHLASILDKCFEPVNLETVHCVYRGFLWMAFMGIPVNKTIEVKTEDVSLIDRRIVINGEEYRIYEESVPCFKVLCNAESFHYTRYTKDVVSLRKESPYLFRSQRIEKACLNTLRERVARRSLQSVGKKYTYDDIARSGVFYRFYECELAGLQPGIDDYVNEKCKGSVARGQVLKSFLSQTKKNLTKDYETWKEAFVPNKK